MPIDAKIADLVASMLGPFQQYDRGAGTMRMSFDEFRVRVDTLGHLVVEFYWKGNHIYSEIADEPADPDRVFIFDGIKDGMLPLKIL